MLQSSAGAQPSEDHLSRLLGLPENTLRGVVLPWPYDDHAHPWARLEVGTLTFPEYWELAVAMAAAREVSLEQKHLLRAFGRGAQVWWPLVHRIVQWRRDYRTALVTNNVAEFGDLWRQTIPVDRLFDEVIDSSRVGFRKPMPEIYTIAAERLGVALQRCVFLDDVECNVDGARAVGMHAIHVHDPMQGLADLEALLAGDAGS